MFTTLGRFSAALVACSRPHWVTWGLLLGSSRLLLGVSWDYLCRSWADRRRYLAAREVLLGRSGGALGTTCKNELEPDPAVNGKRCLQVNSAASIHSKPFFVI